MKKYAKTLLIPCAAAALTLGTTMLSFAATGWQEEDGTWRYYDKDERQLPRSLRNPEMIFSGWMKMATWQPVS